MATATVTATATKITKVIAGGGSNGGSDSGGDRDGNGDNNKNQTTINLMRQQKKRWQRQWRWHQQWRWRWRWQAVAAVAAVRCSGLRGSSSKQNVIADTCFLCCFLVRKLNVCYMWHSIVRYCGRGHGSFLYRPTSTYVLHILPSGNPAGIPKSGIPDQINLALE